MSEGRLTSVVFRRASPMSIRAFMAFCRAAGLTVRATGDEFRRPALWSFTASGLSLPGGASGERAGSADVSRETDDARFLLDAECWAPCRSGSFRSLGDWAAGEERGESSRAAGATAWSVVGEAAGAAGRCSGEASAVSGSGEAGGALGMSAPSPRPRPRRRSLTMFLSSGGNADNSNGAQRGPRTFHVKHACPSARTEWSRRAGGQRPTPASEEAGVGRETSGKSGGQRLPRSAISAAASR